MWITIGYALSPIDLIPDFVPVLGYLDDLLLLPGLLLICVKLIPDEVVRDLMAVGTSHECRDKVAEYVDAGVTCPILFPMMDDIKAVVDAFANWSP